MKQTILPILLIGVLLAAIGCQITPPDIEPRPDLGRQSELQQFASYEELASFLEDKQHEGYYEYVAPVGVSGARPLAMDPAVE